MMLLYTFEVNATLFSSKIYPKVYDKIIYYYSWNLSFPFQI